MRASSAETDVSDKRGGTKPLFVYVGISLFVLGFLLTIVSSSGPLTVAESSSDTSASLVSEANSELHSAIAFAGIFIGLLGVITATVGPLIAVVRSTEHK